VCLYPEIRRERRVRHALTWTRKPPSDSSADPKPLFSRASKAVSNVSLAEAKALDDQRESTR